LIPEINIISQDGDSVTFMFMHFLNSISDMVSVYYPFNVHETDCNMIFNVTEGIEKEYNAYCTDESAAVSIYVYVGESFVSEECEACMAPAENSTDIVAYYFELPCIAECEPPCIEIENAEIKESIGASVSMPYGAVKIVSQNGQTVQFKVNQFWHDADVADMIAVHYQASSSETDCDIQLNVTFDVSKTYTAYCFDNYAHVSVYVYVGESFVAEECEACQAPAENATDVVAYYFELPCVSPCYDPTSLTEATMPGCYDGPYLPPNGVEGSCMYDEIPIDIVHMSTDGATVEFTVKHTWYDMTQYGSVEPVGYVGSMDFIATQYTSEVGPICETKPDVGPGLIQANTFTAQCINNIAEVWIYVQDDEALAGSDVSITDGPSGCAGFDITNEVCSYYFNLPCKEGELLCPVSTPTASTRRTTRDLLLQTPTPAPDMTDCATQTSHCAGKSNGQCSNDSLCTGNWGNDNNFQCLPADRNCSRPLKVKPDSESLAAKGASASVNEPSENYEENLPYCVTEDFPCEGDEDDMVYVCHYNGRKGYRTFCVPARDTDILRFHRNDYCGPCEGGYGGLWK
jgi:hypothetical protein